MRQRTEDAYSDPNLSLREREEAIHGMDLGNDSFYDVVSGDFVANKGGLTPVENFYVGGVPTKPMKPQRLKKGGLAKPKAKPKKMKKGGLASSRKK